MSAHGDKQPLHPEETVTSLFLIRHGHTKPTEDGRLYSDPSADLTARGREQAEALAQWVSKKTPDVVVCSEAVRVLSTASIICRSTELEPVTIKGFDEWRVGEWEGLSYWDIKASQPELYAKWSEDPICNRPPGGESIADLCKRAQDNLLQLLKRYEGQRIAFVTHAGIIRAILAHALETPVRNFWRLSIPVASISRVDFSATFATVQFVALKLD